NNIFVVVGKNNPDKELIKTFCDKNSKFKYHYQIDYFAKLMQLSTFAICAAGSTTWERYCLGLPAIVIAVARNQVEICKSLDKLGVDFFIGESGSYDETLLIDFIMKLSRDWENISKKEKAI